MQIELAHFGDTALHPLYRIHIFANRNIGLLSPLHSESFLMCVFIVHEQKIQTLIFD